MTGLVTTKCGAGPLTRAEPLARLSDRGSDAGEGASPSL